MSYDTVLARLPHTRLRTANVKQIADTAFCGSDDDLDETEEMAELRAEHRRLTRQAQQSKARAQELYERTALNNKVTVEWSTQRRQGATA